MKLVMHRSMDSLAATSRCRCAKSTRLRCHAAPLRCASTDSVPHYCSVVSNVRAHRAEHKDANEAILQILKKKKRSKLYGIQRKSFALLGELGRLERTRERVKHTNKKKWERMFFSLKCTKEHGRKYHRNIIVSWGRSWRRQRVLLDLQRAQNRDRGQRFLGTCLRRRARSHASALRCDLASLRSVRAEEQNARILWLFLSF
jgi:hypothetical protein